LSDLALDLSKKRTGWAVLGDGWRAPRYGSWHLGSEYTADGGVFAKLHQEMAALHSVMPFERIYIEEPVSPAHLSGFTTIQTIRLLAGIAAHVHSFAHAYGLPKVTEINVSSWRPDFIGRIDDAEAKARARRAKKAGDKKASATDELKRLTIERCQQFGFKPRSNDEADAIGILTYAILSRGETPPWLADEVLRPPLAMGGAK
jgi:hypothetical protein